MANTSQPRRSTVEPLENRTLLSNTTIGAGGIGGTTTTPVSGGTVLAAGKAGDFTNTSSSLSQLYTDYRRFRNGGGVSSRFDSSSYSQLTISGDQVQVYVQASKGIDTLTGVLRGLGGRITARSKPLGVISASLSIGQLHTLALSKGVSAVTPVIKATNFQRGTSNNQADKIEHVDTARSTFGLDGAGTKVGVISDSVDQLRQGLAGSIATGDLPDSVQVLRDGPIGSTDEGRGMLELIHDLAPSAALAFSTDDGGQLAAAQSVRALRASGANVIVDDFRYNDEPMFQPGVIEDAINDVVADGATYFSSAGNGANNGYSTSLSYTTVGNKREVDFADGSAVDNRLTFTTTTPGFLVIQWDNPYNGVTGKATTDLDAFLYNNRYTNRLVSQSVTDNLATGGPIEIIQVPAASTYQLELDVAQRADGSVLPRHLRMVYSAESPDAFVTEYTTPDNDAEIYGHNGGVNVISTGAVSAQSATLFADGTSTELDNEDFSSQGPVVYYFDADGNRLAAPVTYNKPDVSGIDDVNTSFFPDGGLSTDEDSLPNFSGTSAAAPDVASIALLIYQADPSATSSQIREALAGTATPLNGVDSQDYDPTGGSGLIDATKAVAQFVSNPTVQIQQVSTSATPTDSIRIIFSQQVQNFDISDLTLTMDGGENLLSGNNLLTTDDGGRTYMIPNLSNVTNTPGDYTLTLRDQTGIVNLTGLTLVAGDAITFTQATPTEPRFPAASAASSALKAISSTAIQVRFVDQSDDESGFTLQRSTESDFSDAVKTFQLGEATSFVDDNLTPSTTYYYRVRAFNFAGQSRFVSLGSATTLATGEVILDNESSRGVSNHGFVTRSSASGFLGSSYLEDNNTGKGDKFVTYTPTLTKNGSYFVYIRYPAASNNATNVPVTITTAGGKTKTVIVNQRKNGNGYVLLGTFNLDSTASLKISNLGTNGHVIADAVRFLPTTG